MLRIIRSTDQRALDRLFRSRAARLEEAEPVARRILADVRRQGDRALVRYARKLDGVDLRKAGFTVEAKEINEAYRLVSPGFVEALRVAERNIRAAATADLSLIAVLLKRQALDDPATEGVNLWQIVRPLECVACYIPGGRFPLPSTVLMSVIPAQVARVREIVITSPRPAPAVVVAAHMLGVKHIYRLGGAQAIAAFAYGTESVPRADKIVGPGNRYVAAAKKLVAGECGIDFVAGPTELVIVGSRGRPKWIAADLVAQAEHDPDAVAVFITSSRLLALKVQAAAESLVRELDLPVARQSLSKHGAIIVTRRASDAVDLVNTFAPEHLVLLDDGGTVIVDDVQAAGSIFLGDHSAVAAGDYASGSNHILPTGGAARVRGGLSPADFVKTISVQRLSRRGLSALRPAIVTLAETEGLKAHARSVEARFKG